MNQSSPIFMTGCSGIAGTFSAKELEERGYVLKKMVRSLQPTDSYQYVQGNLDDLNRLNEISRNNSGIIHYACASLRGRADPIIDIEAMKILLSNWEYGKFVFISSVDVYGLPHTKELIDENYPLSGRMNHYAAGKVACEALLLETAISRGRNDFTIFRPPWIFAPTLASRKHIQSRFLDIFKKDILLPGETEEEWNKFIDMWVDARDLAWLVAESIDNPLGGAGNVIGSQFSWHEFFTILNRLVDNKKTIVHEAMQKNANQFFEIVTSICAYSDEKIKNHYQFEPKYHLETTLAEAFNIFVK